MQTAVSLPQTSSLRSWLYLFSLVPGVLTIAGNLTGGYWAWANLLFSFVGLALIERIAPQVRDNAPADEGYRLPNLILALHTALPLFTVGSLLLGAYTGLLSGWVLVGAILSTGTHSGSSAIVVAHELCHRKEVAWRWGSRWLLFTAMNPYFYVAHVKGHHKLVATHEDPASARRGENLYAFALRSIIGQTRETWTFEVERLRAAKASPYSLRHYYIGAMVLTVLFVALLFLLSPIVALAFVAQGVLACFLLEYTNYIEHYGLSRSKVNGVLERVMPVHSWEANHATRFLLVDLSRHPDHHHFGARPYHQLRSHAEAPQLPTGYSGMIWPALVPPVFFAIMHPAIDKFLAEKSTD